MYMLHEAVITHGISPVLLASISLPVCVNMLQQGDQCRLMHQTDGQTDGQTDRQAGRRTDRQTD